MNRIKKENLHLMLGVTPDCYNMTQMLDMLSEIANWSLDPTGEIAFEYSNQKIHTMCSYTYRISAVIFETRELLTKDVVFYTNNYEWVQKNFDDGVTVHLFRGSTFTPMIAFREYVSTPFTLNQFSELWNQDILNGTLKLFITFNEFDDKKYKELLKFYYQLTETFPGCKYEIYRNNEGKISIKIFEGNKLLKDSKWYDLTKELPRIKTLMQA